MHQSIYEEIISHRGGVEEWGRLESKTNFTNDCTAGSSKE